MIALGVKDIERLLDWFGIVTSHEEDTIADHKLAEKLWNMATERSAR